MDKGVLVTLCENPGCDLPTGIAVDAGRIHEEVAGDVFGQSFLGVCHYRASRLGFILCQVKQQNFGRDDGLNGDGVLVGDGHAIPGAKAGS